MHKKDKFSKRADIIDQFKVQCPCGTKTVLINTDKAICRGCHNYVFKDKKTEFEHRIKESLLK